MESDAGKSAFAMRLEAEMSASGISDRAHLARVTGIPYHRLNPWFIRPSAKPNAGDLLILARTLNVSERYLLDGGERSTFNRMEDLIHRARRLSAEDQRRLEEYLDFLEAKKRS